MKAVLVKIYNIIKEVQILLPSNNTGFLNKHGGALSGKLKIK